MSADSLREFGNLSHRMRHLAHQRAKEYGIELLGGPQGRVIHYLAHHQGKEVVIKDIERELQISKSVASNLIKRMEKNHFITVEVSKTDKRKKVLGLSASSKEKADKMGLFWADMQKGLLEGVAPADFQVFSRVLKQMSQNVEKIEKGRNYD